MRKDGEIRIKDPQVRNRGLFSAHLNGGGEGRSDPFWIRDGCWCSPSYKDGGRYGPQPVDWWGMCGFGPLGEGPGAALARWAEEREVVAWLIGRE